jgi:two-component system, chemotaxis family, chemotaxis protein CheY
MADMKMTDMKTLVVDDHIIIRRDLEKFLTNMGCRHVDQAANAEEAQKKIAGEQYNIVFLDWNMPGKSGFHLLQQCRADKAFDNVAFVIVSAESDDRYIIEALKAGATSYIVKPVSEATLQEHLIKVLAWIGKRPSPPRQQSA